MSLNDKDLTFFEKRTILGGLRSEYDTTADSPASVANSFIPGIVERSVDNSDIWYNAGGDIWLVITVHETPIPSDGTMFGFTLAAGTGASAANPPVLSSPRACVTIPPFSASNWVAGRSYGVSFPIVPVLVGAGSTDLTHLQIRRDQVLPAGRFAADSNNTPGSFSAFLTILPPSSARSLPGPIGRT